LNPDLGAIEIPGTIIEVFTSLCKLTHGSRRTVASLE